VLLSVLPRWLVLLEGPAGGAAHCCQGATAVGVEVPGSVGFALISSVLQGAAAFVLGAVVPAAQQDQVVG